MSLTKIRPRKQSINTNMTQYTIKSDPQSLKNTSKRPTAPSHITPENAALKLPPHVTTNNTHEAPKIP
jgi:hypothetical protein